MSFDVAGMSFDVERVAETPRRISRWQMAVGALGAVVLLWVGGSLFDVVTGGGPGDDRAPSGVHDPSRFGHGPP